MKKLSLIIALFCFAIFATAQPSYNYQKRFQVKSGHVEYELSGMTTGTKSLWWDDFGDKYREETNSSETVKTFRGTEVVKNHSLSISDGTYYYNVNMATMEGTRIHKKAIPDFSLLGSGLNDSEMEQHGESLMNAFGGKVNKKSEQVLGRTCDVGQVAGATVHVYKGVTLRSHARINSYENREEAVSFDENISIPASKFSPPDNAFIEDATSDVMSDIMGYQGFDDDIYEEEQGLLFPSGITFEQFRNESDRVRRKLGYTFAMHDASGGQYSAIWSKTDNNLVGLTAYSLQNYARWREDFASLGAEYFTKNGIGMGFYKDIDYDEEEGTKRPISVLLVEVKSKDAFFQLTSSPEKSKQELINIFYEFNF